MHAFQWSNVRARRLAGVGLAGLLSIAGVAWGGGTAWGASDSPARHATSLHHVASRKAGRHKHHRPRLPRIGNATTMSVEPVVHAMKGARPKKLEVKDLVVGTGAAVTLTSTVSVKYVGADYATGKDFTSATWSSGRPTTFPLSEVVPGFA